MYELLECSDLLVYFLVGRPVNLKSPQRWGFISRAAGEYVVCGDVGCLVKAKDKNRKFCNVLISMAYPLSNPLTDSFRSTLLLITVMIFATLGT